MQDMQRNRHAHFGPFSFDLVAQTITKEGVVLPFEPRHFFILKCLIDRRSEIVRCTDEDLSEAFSSQPEVEDKHRAFTKYLSEMRNLMGRTVFKEHIENVPKARDLEGRLGGYRFIGTVSYQLRSKEARNRQRVREEGIPALTAIVRRRNYSTLPILTRDEVDHAVGTVEYRLKHAQEEIWISGNDNMFVAKVLSPFVVRALKDGRKVRLLGVDPKSPAASMLSIIDPRFEGDTFKREIDFVTEVARGWRIKYPHFEYRLLPILPALGYFITDPKLPSKTVKIEIYTTKPWDPLDSRPHLVINDSMPQWREYFIQQFENYWHLSETPK